MYMCRSPLVFILENIAYSSNHCLPLAAKLYSFPLLKSWNGFRPVTTFHFQRATILQLVCPVIPGRASYSFYIDNLGMVCIYFE